MIMGNGPPIHALGQSNKKESQGARGSRVAERLRITPILALVQGGSLICFNDQPDYWPDSLAAVGGNDFHSCRCSGCEPHQFLVGASRLGLGRRPAAPYRPQPGSAAARASSDRQASKTS